jgi:hypothetical protein
MDAAGSSMTVEGTASVSEAPLRASGDFRGRALVGTATDLTVASFGDGNADDDAGNYEAVIDWGDGTTTIGNVLGGNGEFVVKGNHAYSDHGAYTVRVSVTDEDGTTARATSAVTVGDLYKGLPSELTAATFRDADPNGSLEDYTATIDWGDGSSGPGVIVADGNGFRVVGNHAYGQEGSYSVIVAVLDQGGNSLTGIKDVVVVAGPVTAYADVLAGRAGVPFENEQVAVFTDPDIYDTAGEYSAVIDWGDGTSSAGVVVGAGGFFQVLGSHAYAEGGSFQGRVQIFWQDPEKEAEVVFLAELDQQRELKGAMVVPGRSRYTYQVDVGAGNVSYSKWVITSTDNTASIVSSRRIPHLNLVGMDLSTTLEVTVQFDNKPAEVRFKVFYKNEGVLRAAIFPEVYVVQVKVEAPDAPAQAFVKPPADRTPRQGTLQVDNPPRQPRVGIQMVGAEPGAKRFTNLRRVLSGDVVEREEGRFVGKPALTWKAKVTLTGFTDQNRGLRNVGVDRIRVGFIQHATQTAKYVTFPTRQRKLVSATPVENALDVVNGPGPWYDSETEAILEGGSGTIKSEDTPVFDYPVLYLKNDPEVAGEIRHHINFTLDVAAATSDQAAGADQLRWQESTAPWSVDLSGTVKKETFGWIRIPGVTGIDAPAGWQDPRQPVVQVPVDPPTVRSLAESETWTEEDL